MPLVVQQTRMYPAPVQTLWDVVSDHCGLNRWLLPGMTITLNPPGTTDPNGTDAVRIISRGPYTVREKITHFQPPKTFSYTVISGFPVQEHLGTLELEPTPTGCKLTWTITFESKFYGLGWFLKIIITRMLTGGLNRLTALIESD